MRRIDGQALRVRGRMLIACLSSARCRVAERRKQCRVESKWAIDQDSLLAYLYAPILPYVKKIPITRRGPRGHNPKDILLPQGYTAEVVATGLNTPVHCCFDDDGFCYVIECGHKVDARLRILKLDTRTGRYETFRELPQERWTKTGAVTGACWHQSYLYVSNTDSIFRVGRSRTS
jgi:hypothetical protein